MNDREIYKQTLEESKTDNANYKTINDKPTATVKDKLSVLFFALVKFKRS